MLVKYYQGSTLTDAVLKTFDGKHPCGLCEFVAEGKQQQKKQDLVKLEQKLDFFMEAGLKFVIAIDPEPAFQGPHGLFDQVAHRPLSPPPRFA